MSDVVAVPNLPTESARPNRIDCMTPRVRKAVDLMVWHGKPYDEAAKEVGLTTRAMRLALGKPHVVAAVKRELQVLRESEQPRNIRRLVQIRDKADNMPAVQAIDRLMRSPDDVAAGSGASASPGITIRIINQAPTPPTIDVTPDRLTHD
jgi:hypothetical protein